MSKTEIMKPSAVVICDWCDEEIIKTDQKEWAHINTKYNGRPTQEAKYLQWLFEKRVVIGTIEYDFHADCFKPMMDAVEKIKGGTIK